MLPAEPVPEQAVDQRRCGRDCEKCEKRSCETLWIQGCLDLKQDVESNPELCEPGKSVQGINPV